MTTVKKRLPKLLQLLVIVVLIFTTGMQPAYAAYTLTSIQCTVDDVNWQIVAGIVDDKYKWTDSHVLEGDRIGASDLEALRDNGGNPSVGAGLLGSLNISSPREGYHNDVPQLGGFVLTFPGEPQQGVINPFKSSSEYDKTRATVVKDVLLYDLNAAYQLVYGGNAPDDLNAYKSNMIQLLNAVNGGSINGFSFSKGTSKAKFADKSLSSTDYVTITKGEEVMAELVYRIPKGYISVGSYSAPDTLIGGNNDATYITWGELAYEAFANYTLDEKLAVTTENVYSSTANSLESALAGMLGNLFNWLAGALGLWNLDDLILNAGIRSTSSYVGGIFPSSWESTIWAFFFIAEVIALIALSFAILLGIYKKAMSTVNPMMRASLMDQMKHTFIAIFAIILMPVLLRLLIQTSASFTRIFTIALGDDKTATEALSIYAKQSGTLGGCIIQFVYLIALLYFNFFYYMRSLTMAALIILSPIAVLFSCFGDQSRSITKAWVNILLSTVLIQPIHALCLVILLLLPNEGRMFQNIIGVYAMIPLTQTLMNMFIREGAGLHMFASRGQHGSTMLMKTGAASVAGAVGGAAGAYIGGKAAASDARGSGVNTNGSASAESYGRDGATNGEAPANTTSNTSSGGYSPTGGAVSEGAATGAATAGVTAAAGMAASEGMSDTSSNSVPGNSHKDITETEGRLYRSNNNSPEAQSLLNDYQTTSDRHANQKWKSGAALAGGMALSAMGGALSPWGFGRHASIAGLTVARSAGHKSGLNDREYNKQVENLDRAGEAMLGSSAGNQAQAGQTEVARMYANQSVPDAEVMSAFDAIQEQPEHYASANFSDTSDGRAYTDRDGLKEIGMDVERGDKAGQKVVSYSAGNLSARDTVQMEAAYDVFQNGTPEQKQVLIDSGINDVTVDRNHNTGAVQYYEMNVDTQKLNENYGINLSDKRHGAYVTSFNNPQSIVPNVISSEKIGARKSKPVRTTNPAM